MGADETDHTRKAFNSYDKILKDIAGQNGIKISCDRFPVKDLDIPDSENMTHILDAIDESMAKHNPVYVHCWGGIGRTGTVIGCFLIRHGLANSHNVLDVIARLRINDPKAYRSSPETPDQVEFVKTWSKSEHGKPTKLNRYLGSLVGLAIGDALGTTLEFKSPGLFEPIDDMVGGGPFRLNPGEWTDDTSMALCLADSLIKCQGFDAKDQMERYCRWWKEGYLSSNGTCFDIGETVFSALSKFQNTGNPFGGSAPPVLKMAVSWL